MLELTITNRANEDKPLRIQDLPDGKSVALLIADEIARVSVEELERAITACKHERD